MNKLKFVHNCQKTLIVSMVVFNIIVYVVTDYSCDNYESAYIIKISQFLLSAALFSSTVFIASIFNYLIAVDGHLYWCRNADEYKEGRNNKVFYTDTVINEKTRLRNYIASTIESIAHGGPNNNRASTIDITLPLFLLSMIILLIAIIISDQLLNNYVSLSQYQIQSALKKSLGFSIVQISCTIFMNYYIALIDMCDLIGSNNSKCIKFSDYKAKIYDHLCKSVIIFEDEYAYDPKNIVPQLKNHIAFLKESEQNVIIDDINHLTPEIIDMILDSKIKINFPYRCGLSTLTKIALINFYAHQKSTDQSVFVNRYEIKSNLHDTTINMRSFFNDAKELLMNDNYVKIHGMVADFVNICEKFAAKEKEKILLKQQKTFELLTNKGIDVNSKYLADSVYKTEDDIVFRITFVNKE